MQGSSLKLLRYYILWMAMETPGWTSSKTNCWSINLRHIAFYAIRTELKLAGLIYLLSSFTTFIWRQIKTCPAKMCITSFLRKYSFLSVS